MKRALRDLVFAIWAVVIAHFVVEICERMTPAHPLTPAEAGLGILALALPLFAAIRWAFSDLGGAEVKSPVMEKVAAATSSKSASIDDACSQRRPHAGHEKDVPELRCDVCCLPLESAVAVPPQKFGTRDSYFLWVCQKKHGWMRQGVTLHDRSRPLVPVSIPEALNALLG